MTERRLTCILCPNGCELQVTWDGEPTMDTVCVDGNLCPKGYTYALDELTHPMRTLTTSVLVRNGVQRLTSVKTAAAIPRDALSSVRAALRPMQLDAPVAIGDVVLSNAGGTGVDVVVTRAVSRRSTEGSP